MLANESHSSVARFQGHGLYSEPLVKDFRKKAGVSGPTTMKVTASGGLGLGETGTQSVSNILRNETV